MPILDIVNQFIQNSNIPEAFGLDVNSFLILISGSFIVGYICLTFHYKVFYDHSSEKWDGLKFSEKAIISLLIGFLSIFLSQFFIAIYQVLYNSKDLERILLQFNYIAPFIYFIFLSALNGAKNYQKLEFIKMYIKVSGILILIFSIVFPLVVFYINKVWDGVLAMLMLLILYIIFFCVVIYLPKHLKSFKLF